LTHDQAEALTMSDRIAVMHDGRADACRSRHRHRVVPLEGFRLGLRET